MINVCGPTRVKDVDADFVSLWGRDLDGLELQGLSSGPANSGLAGDGFSSGVGHGVEGSGSGREKGGGRMGREGCNKTDRGFRLTSDPALVLDVR